MDRYVRIVAATATQLHDVDLSEVATAVGSRSFDRGRAYARAARVAVVEWDPEDGTLTGSVAGNGGLYETVAFFVGDSAGALEFEDGECTCPVGYNCKHVAALVIAATEAVSRSPAGRSRRQRARRGSAPAWEAPLRALHRAAGAAGSRQPAGDRAGAARRPASPAGARRG